MPCLASTAVIAAGCAGPRMGGVSAIYLFLRSATSNASVSDNIDFGIATNAAPGAGKRIPFKGSFQTVPQVDESTGQVYYRDELTGSIENDISIEPQVLAKLGSAGPDDLVIGVERRGGKLYILGYGFKDPDGDVLIPTSVFFNGGPGITTGTEKGDDNGMGVSFVSVHPQPAALAEISPSEISNPSTD